MTNPTDSEQLFPDLGRLQSTLRKMVRWETLFSIETTTGIINFTVRDYGFFMGTVKALLPYKNLPS